MAMVTSLVSERPVVIFSKSSCCMCHTIKTLISNFGANPTVYELDEHPDGKRLEKELRGLGCKPSVPAVFMMWAQVWRNGLFCTWRPKTA
ncbi:putative thioredoxin-disulfide reductase [Helianthus annuus]|nr:putative thioredoxin-disulfide reductase [Helianthus annuus]KAJ0620871.1 putative thioredoxin-disulfide reductase [Helianthus annuus]KAJ0781871.1 putative thioredoxin-disulfide reductase [Helianthus annuus]